MLIFLWSLFIFTSCTTRSTCLYCKIIVHLVLGLLHRSTGRTAWFMDSIADQLIGLFAARASSPATPVTPQRLDSSCSRSKWAHFTARTSPATPRTPRCSDLATYAEDSSVLGRRRLCRGLLSALTSPPTPRTPRSSVLGHRQRHRGLPYCSDLATSCRCAIKLLHAV